MLPDLYLTPTRRDLMTACHEGRVIEGHEDDHVWLVEEGCPNRKVCYRIHELDRAGYVALDEAQVFWEVTNAGRVAMGWQPEAVAADA